MPWSFHFMDKSVFKIFPASAGNGRMITVHTFFIFCTLAIMKTFYDRMVRFWVNHHDNFFNKK